MIHALMLLILLLASLCTSLVQAQTVPQCSLARPCQVLWNANTEPDMQDYRLWLRRVEVPDFPVTPFLVIQHPSTSVTDTQFRTSLGELIPGRYALAVTARDLALNESAKSNSVIFDFVVVDTTPPVPPVLRILEVTIP